MPLSTTQNKVVTRLSQVNIPLDINILTLNELINQQIGKVLFEDNSRKNDNLTIKATRAADIQIEVMEQAFIYEVPVDIFVEKFYFLGSVKGNGAIKIKFKTAYQIEKDWNVQTQTSLMNVVWLRQPKMEVGGMKFSVKSIIDRLIERKKQMITTSIDQQLKSRLQLRQLVERAWEYTRTPILLSPEYQAYLMLEPRVLNLSPFQVHNQHIKSKISLIAETHLHVGEQTSIKEQPQELPPFSNEINPEKSFQLNIDTFVSFDLAAKQAEQRLVGKTFSQANQTIKIEAIQFRSKQQKLLVDLQLSGSFNGNIYLEGIPDYDVTAQLLQIKELSFKMETQNLVFKSLAWLFKRGIIKQLEESLQIPLDQQIATIKSFSKTKLKELSVHENVFLDGEIQLLQIENLTLKEKGIVLSVFVEGYLNVLLGQKKVL